MAFAEKKNAIFMFALKSSSVTFRSFYGYRLAQYFAYRTIPRKKKIGKIKKQEKVKIADNTA